MALPARPFVGSFRDQLGHAREAGHPNSFAALFLDDEPGRADQRSVLHDSPTRIAACSPLLASPTCREPARKYPLESVKEARC